MFRVIVLVLLLNSSIAQAVTGLPFDPSQFSNLADLISASTANAIIQTVGILSGDRPYEPASSLGTSLGIDLSVEATLFRVPDAFNAALAEAGVTSGATIPVIPIPRLHFHKGLGNGIDIGAETIFYSGLFMWGLDLKVVVFQPEEGPVWAIRLGYAHSFVGFVTTTTYTPALVVSQPLDFMEPYMGVDVQLINGTIGFTPPPPFDQLLGTLTKDGSGYAGEAFGGVAFRIPPLGFKITMEGSYSTAGADALGLKAGLNF